MRQITIMALMLVSLASTASAASVPIFAQDYPEADVMRETKEIKRCGTDQACFDAEMEAFQELKAMHPLEAKKVMPCIMGYVMVNGGQSPQLFRVILKCLNESK